MQFKCLCHFQGVSGFGVSGSRRFFASWYVFQEEATIYVCEFASEEKTNLLKYE